MRDILKVLSIGVALYGFECSAQTVSGKNAGRDYVDLGLPSGRLWATYNVGATKPFEYGDYFAWGETEPKGNYSENTYKWCIEDGSGYYDKFSKYVKEDNFGTIDNKTVLELADDAATANWGSGWRMPTYDDMKELIGGCEWKWTSDFNGTGVSGQIGTSKSNGSTIFFPAAGTYVETELLTEGDDGIYWTSSLGGYSTRAYYLYFIDRGIDCYDNNKRNPGRSVRAVVSENSSCATILNKRTLQAYSDNGTIHISNAQPNANIQVFVVNGKLSASGTTSVNGDAGIPFPASNGVCVVTVGNISTKVILK